ncbi:hypothetical protein TERTU_2730 [Teredinibacter turnerae T7901]|uniref:Uncharacterized protein n=1 Tax=Teredinibacter turnerae (strain ATCC 39867 / T7901) TaxID=377629 RepID=C5BMH9_TERTT|nr:hypothetical protein TERTU_2730 [Teredinibacter turnerae T7901]
MSPVYTQWVISYSNYTGKRPLLRGAAVVIGPWGIMGLSGFEGRFIAAIRYLLLDI